MTQSQLIELFSENLHHVMQGALMMLFVGMCMNLYPKRGESSILNYLFWILVTMAAFLLVSLGSMFEKFDHSEKVKHFIILTDLCLVPLVGSLLLKIMIPDWINLRRILLLLTPTILFMLIYLFTNKKLTLSLSFAYTIILIIAMFVFVVYVSVRYDRYLKNNFSNIDNKTVIWVRTVVCFFVAWYAVWCVIVLADITWLNAGYYLVLIFMWIFIYRHSISHIAVVNIQELFDQSIEPVEPQSEIMIDVLSSKLTQYINKEQPWLNPSLTLQDVANNLKTNRTYLSEYFNKTLDTTFYDYFNSFRVTHACEQLLSSPNLTLIQISEMSGFNSISTFRRAFEKQLGCTPVQYRKQKLVS